ncbi:MAG: helix-turn-helix transcriptional regulator [Rhizobiales bacterium]|nr:helix-turn-helix transcriptional regulator [Hyphomicrobiales bacterium]OJU29677.1 MAG: transcriptional regulator [Rhizobiales bacterium 68-8]
MTFHPRSVVEFGLFYNRVSDSLLSGAPLRQSAELIRRQFAASAVAIRIEDRAAGGQCILVEAGEPDAGRGDEAERLAQLLETSHHMASTVAGEGDTARYTLTVLRELSAPGFDTEEASVCEILVSQLRRGAELSARIGATEIERALYSRVMDRLSVGVVILDEAGRVVRCSSAAEAALAARDGVQLQAGKLRAASAREDRDLQAAIRAVLQPCEGADRPASRGLSLSRPSGSRNLGVIVQPVPAGGSGLAASARVAVYIRDPEASAEVEGELVRQLFDLTPAEAAVARRLTAGLSLEDAASSLDISRNTARAHLRSIFSKSGITRQTELVRLMLNSAAVLGDQARVA